MEVSIIIPNFNGKELLKENLPVLQSALGNFVCEIIVVDDGSTDGSVEFLKNFYPEMKVISLEKNFGFAYACNVGVREAKGKIVYLLNSDIKVCSGFLEPLIPYFEKDDIFSVSSIELKPYQQNIDIFNIVGIPIVKFKYGIFWYRYYEVPFTYEFLTSQSKNIEVFWVSGGHSAYSKEKFLSLGGFDTLFSPFYVEDGDICWRAWKRGWKSIIEPKSRVIHSPGSTIGKFYSKKKILQIHWKNRTLMTWKNLTSKWLIFKHIFFLIFEIFFLPLLGKKEFFTGVIFAIKQFKEMLHSRRRDRVKKEVFSNIELFKKFSRIPRLTPWNILYLHETGKFSGAEESLLNLVSGIEKKLFNPIFILPEKWTFFKKLNEINVKTFILPFPKIRKFYGVASTIKKLCDIIKKEDISLIHSNSIRTNIYASLAGKICRKPVIWHERNLLTTELIDLDRLFSFLPDKIVCNSKAIAKRFPGNKKVIVIYNGVNTERFNPEIDRNNFRKKFNILPDDIVIGNTSRFGSDKGQEYLLKSAKLILEKTKLKNLKFMLVGDAVFDKDKWRENYLKTLVKKLNIENNVIFTGFVENMPEVYAAIDIFVLTSYAEPCGRVILEAMSSGKPIIATNTGGTPEIIEDKISGILIPPKDEKCLSDAILYLINNKEKMVSLGTQARKRVTEIFNLSVHLEKIQNLYLKCLT